MSRYKSLAVERRSTVEQVQRGLRRLIIDGLIQPGDRLVESAIAKDIGVSRNTAREALRGLVECRLVAYHTDRGFSVARVYARDVEEIYRIRRVLEVGALDRLVGDSSEQLAVLKTSIDHLKESIERTDWDGIVDADMRFHLAIVGLIESPRLTAFLQTLFDELRLALASHDRLGREGSRTVQRHTEIFEAIAAGKFQKGARALERHLAESSRSVVEHLGAAEP